MTSKVATVLAIVLSAGHACAEAVARERMAAADIEAAFRGMTMTGYYADGVKFTETYEPGGNVAYADDNDVDQGNWFEEQGLFCTFYVSGLGACFEVVRKGANCYEFYAAKAQDGSVINTPAWTSVGWDVRKPTTCEPPDKTV